MEPALASDHAGIRRLLLEGGLPVDDLENARVRLWVRRDATVVVATIGLEQFGAAGLLRSLAVDTGQRKHGVGTSLVGSLEQEASARGIDLLVLLTTTAQPFFRRLGYVEIDRAYVPEDIRQSAQFRSLCPATATCMFKILKS